MSHARLSDPLSLARGPALCNRFVLAPLTNQQSRADGRLSDDEYRWLTMRAAGGFGLTMTCASHVQRCGQGFPGQLAIFGDEHLEGLARLARGVKAEGSVTAVQLHHAGIRADRSLVSAPVGPSDDSETGARALSTAEVEQLRDDFVAAALRAERSGFDGVEIHGAHGYVLAQFLSPTLNRREDRYGGALENRARLIMEVVAGVRGACRPDFQLGVRLSPERFGLVLPEVRDVAAELLEGGAVDYLDLSLWDVFKAPDEAAYAGRSLMSWFTDLPRGRARIGAAGKVMGAAEAARVLEQGCDFAVIGRGAILRHDFPRRVLADPAYVSPSLPVTQAHLVQEGLGPQFLDYIGRWPGFIAEAETS